MHSQQSMRRATTRRRLPSILRGATIILAGFTAGAAADPDLTLTKLLPDDGAASDQFGRAIAIDGSTAIVGAMMDDDHGESSGAAYVFDTTTPSQQLKLCPDDGAPYDWFGCSVAIDDTTVVVGSWYDCDNGINAGSAYLFDAQTGAQIAKLLAADGAADDEFGRVVDVDGSIAIVGAYLDDDNGFDSGSAYLFDATTGQQLFKLLPTDGAAGDLFGSAVAICGPIAIVGAPGDDVAATDSGSAYLFDVNTGQQLRKLIPTDAEEEDQFGYAVAISSTIALVGAPYDNDMGPDSGSAYVFSIDTGSQLAKLRPDSDASYVQFGWSVALDEPLALIGAPYDNDMGANAGAAYLFDCETNTRLAKLVAGDGAASDFFGYAVAVQGDSGLIGAMGDDDQGDGSGAAYLASPQSTVPGDLNGDGCVDQADLGILLAAYGNDNGGDIDGDGDTDQADLGALLGHYGEGC